VLAAAVVLGVVSAVFVQRAGRPDEGPASAPTTTAPVRVERRDHRPGDCLTWDQGTGGADARAIVTVACDQPHLVEVTGRLVVAEEVDHPPTEEELDDLTERLCRPVDEAHLGGPLDPDGRFDSAGIQPSPEGWAAGDREVWCALGARDGTESGEAAGRHRPFTGKVSAAAQFWRYERGQCLAAGRRAAVPCAEDHEVELTGTVRVPDAPSAPALDDIPAWDALVGEACRAQARSYLDRDAAEPLTAGWLGVAPGAWRAGDRTAHCLVGQRDDAGGWVTVRGSARSVPS
jgi:hypothetical protein